MFLYPFKKILLGAVLVSAAMVTTIGTAYAVKIIPPRLVIKPDTKVEYFFIKNNSDRKEAFRLGWKHLAMDKDGNVLNLDKIGMENAPNGYRAADKLIRFSPRRVVLEPGQTQRVTMMVRRSDKLEMGEYRSHFLIQREPRTQEAQSTEITNSGGGEEVTPAVSIDVLVSRAVPVYVLQGETNAKLNLLSAEIKKNENKTKPYHPTHLAHFKVQKDGNRSVIGLAKVFCTSGGKEVVISKTTKVFAVYAEGEYRNEKVPVQIPVKGCSSHRIVVKGHSDDVLAGQTLADFSF